MHCIKCGAQIRKTSKFCPKCGAEILYSLDENSNAILRRNKTIKQVRTRLTTDSEAKDVTTTSRSLSSDQIKRLAMDAVLFALATFFPWIGSSYLGSGGFTSLPSLASNALPLLSHMNHYSDYANNLGIGSTYASVAGFVAMISIVAAIGWLSVMTYIYFDVKADLKGTSSEGNGGWAILILAIVVQLIAWEASANTPLTLNTQYVGLSYLGQNVIETTVWVWVSAIVGAASIRFRKYAS